MRVFIDAVHFSLCCKHVHVHVMQTCACPCALKMFMCKMPACISMHMCHVYVRATCLHLPHHSAMLCCFVLLLNWVFRFASVMCSVSVRFPDHEQDVLVARQLEDGRSLLDCNISPFGDQLG